MGAKKIASKKAPKRDAKKMRPIDMRYVRMIEKLNRSLSEECEELDSERNEWISKHSEVFSELSHMKGAREIAQQLLDEIKAQRDEAQKAARLAQEELRSTKAFLASAKTDNAKLLETLAFERGKTSVLAGAMEGILGSFRPSRSATSLAGGGGTSKEVGTTAY